MSFSGPVKLKILDGSRCASPIEYLRNRRWYPVTTIEVSGNDLTYSTDNRSPKAIRMNWKSYLPCVLVGNNKYEIPVEPMVF